MSETNKIVRFGESSPEECRAMDQVLSRIGDKWTVLVVGALSDGPRRYNEIRRIVGTISQRMLTLTLRSLEEDGLVTRTLYPAVPPRVEYELTELAMGLVQVLRPLYDWAVANRPQMDAARAAFRAQREATRSRAAQ